MAVPIPPLNFSAPSAAQSGGTLAPAFNIGSGSAGGLNLTTLVLFGVAAIIALKWVNK